ncbi:MAG: hypothetical protein KA368_06270 [Acidobacteria bacterium]|nr:hypothetical protein [Acidobacteriota bacterium]
MSLSTNKTCLLSHRRAVSLLSCLMIVALVFSTGTGGKLDSKLRQISFDDLPIELHPWLKQQGISRENFNNGISAFRRQTADRELIGEYDHLIFFMLQSSRFTALPKVEPAQSAYEYFQNLSETDRKQFMNEGSNFAPAPDRVPKSAKLRIGDFLKSLKAKQSQQDERLSYFDNLLKKTVPATITPEQHLMVEYARAMRFLYRKEFASRSIKQEELAAYIASLYQNRGHSTDTQVEANFAVYTALAALKASSPKTKLNKVLIVGPGLDFAPRTDLIDLFGPQSYQPFAIADALLDLKLAHESTLQIHCVDINDRVIAHLQNLQQRKEVRLSLLSGVRESAAHPIAEDYKNYFRDFGKSIGIESRLEVPDEFSTHLGKSLRIRPELVKTVSVDRLNIVAERYADSHQFDLVIVTNVFPYFSPPELLFALANISSMMAEGGYLIHNELQTVPSTFVTAVGLPLRQARTVMITSDKVAPLFDGVAIHQKTL